MYYGSEEDEFSSMSMGSEELEAFGMSDSYGYGEEEEEQSLGYGYEESYEMSSDELSVEHGEDDCVDDFGIEQEEEEEPMSYEDLHATSQRNDDDLMEEEQKNWEDLLIQEDEREWHEREEDEEQGWYEREEDISYSRDEESSLDTDWSRDFWRELSWNDRIAFGLANSCDCEHCSEVMFDVMHDLSSLKVNSSELREFHICPSYAEEFSDEGWRLLGQYIANNDELESLDFSGVILTDEIISLLSTEIQRNRSAVEVINFANTGLGVEGVRGLAPILSAFTTIVILNFDANRIRDEGLDIILRALVSSPVESLLFDACGIKDFTIFDGLFPKHVFQLSLCSNMINSVGCRALAQLLQREDSALKVLLLRDNDIDDEGVGFLADSLRTNKSLTGLDLRGNPITEKGHANLAGIVNDVSSIKATLSSNHVLENVKFGFDVVEEDSEIILLDDYVDACLYSYPAQLMQDALTVNSTSDSPEQAGRRKMINTQLNIIRRNKLSRLQGLQNNGSLFADIDCPLHLLPEILALVGGHHKLSEMFAAVSTSIGILTSLSVRRKDDQLKNRRNNLSLDMRDIAGEIKSLVLAERFSREDQSRKEFLISLKWVEKSPLWSLLNGGSPLDKK